MDEFKEVVVAPESDQFIGGYCEVSTRQDGYFVAVETDPSEGMVFMTLPLAEKVYEALGRAIAHAKEQQSLSKK